jgi:hypothetical protein
MIEMTNLTRGPVQIVVRTAQGKKFTCLNIPGIGKHDNIRFIEDERHTDYIDKAEKDGLIKVRRVKQAKGE